MAGTASDILIARLKAAYNANHPDHLALVVPLSFKVALFTEAAGLQQGVPTYEVSASSTGYARQSVAFNADFFSATSVTFPTPGPNNWGVLKYYAIYAEVSSGSWELWWYGRTKDPSTGQDLNLTVNAGDPAVYFKAGDLGVVLS